MGYFLGGQADGRVSYEDRQAGKNLKCVPNWEFQARGPQGGGRVRKRFSVEGEDNGKGGTVGQDQSESRRVRGGRSKKIQASRGVAVVRRGELKPPLRRSDRGLVRDLMENTGGSEKGVGGSRQ